MFLRFRIYLCGKENGYLSNDGEKKLVIRIMGYKVFEYFFLLFYKNFRFSV